MIAAASPLPLASYLPAILLDLDQEGIARLPHVPGLPWSVGARWVQRRMIGESWRPLVFSEPSALSPVYWPDILELARRGWVAIPSGHLPPDFAPLARQAGVGLLLPDPTEATADVAALLRQDRHHAVETDPSLRDLRRSLLAHCRGNATVHLSGPVGSGKRTLVAWAHRSLDDRPLTVVGRSGGRQLSPGRWTHFEELGELSPEQFHQLKSCLQAAHPPDLPLSGSHERLPRPHHAALAQILGESPSLSRVLRDVLRVAPLGIPVLILGESGVGKESLARAVHDAGGRKGPYRVLDLSTINESLVESELFGHVRGAFTGADRERQGAFRQAQGGTLFLDELGNLSPRVQAKLLRVLQEKLVFPVGGDSAFSVDVRVVAATNADLETMVARGLFREDLLRRLNAVTLVLPPLRERPEDIPLLAQHFAAQHRPPGSPPITTEALEILQRWPWPGNIRELGNVLARAAAEAGRSAIQPQHLGSLAPGGQRPVPLLSSASDEAWLRMEPYASDRSLSHQLTAVTLKLAPVRERGAGAIRNAVLSLLDGHPIRVEAMRLLERYPWWGNWTELEAAISALKANIPGIIDRESLEQTLPHLLRTGQEPIRVLLHPTIQHGSLKGFQQDFFEEALLVGRVGSLADALRLAAEDPSLEPRLEQLRARLRGAAPACLDLAQLPQLSRLHFLICREPEGLRLDVLAGARRGLWAGSLDEELRYVAPGTSLFLGRAGELQVRNDSGGPPALQMLSFAGAIAQEEGSEKAVQRLAAARQRPGRTVDLGRPERWEADPVEKAPPPPASSSQNPAPVREKVPGEGEGRLTVWELSAEETAWLTGVVCSFDGGDFKAALERAAVDAAPSLARLLRYLQSARPTQYAGRMYEHPVNGGLRQATAEALAALPDPDAQLERLPLAIRRAVEGLLG